MIQKVNQTKMRSKDEIKEQLEYEENVTAKEEIENKTDVLGGSNMSNRNSKDIVGWIKKFASKARSEKVAGIHDDNNKNSASIDYISNASKHNNDIIKSITQRQKNLKMLMMKVIYDENKLQLENDEINNDNDNNTLQVKNWKSWNNQDILRWIMKLDDGLFV